MSVILKLKHPDGRIVEIEAESIDDWNALSSAQKHAAFSKAYDDDEPITKESAFAALETGLEEFCKAQGITKNPWTEGLDRYRNTPEGRRLSDDYNDHQ